MQNIFEFFTKDKNAPTSENSAEDAGNIPGSTLRVDSSESAETIRKAATGSKPKSESGKGTGATEKGNAPTVEQQQQLKMLEDLFDPKVWKAAAGAPGDAMHAITGKEYWTLSNDERETLSKTGAATARCFAMTDPKWLALSLFSFSIVSIYGSRVMKQMMDTKKEKANAMPKTVVAH